MATTIAKLNIHVGASTTALEQGMERAQLSVSRFAGLAAKAFSLVGGLASLGTGVKLAADAEQAQVAYSTLLGSMEAANRTLAEINQFAAETPFGTAELRDAGRMLAAFGTEAEQITPLLRQLGDLAAGTNQPIGGLAEIFGKAKVQGRLFMEDINQLTGRGIPIIGELAKQFGVAEVAVRKLVETGQVNFSHLEAALQSMTGAGGKFGGLMEAQSKTLAGTWSTLTDNVALLATEVGTKLLPAFKAAADVAIVLTDQIAALDGNTVRSIAQFAALGAAFAATVYVVPRVITAVRAVIATLRALATTSAIVQGVTGGIGGVAKVLLGLAAGAAAAVGVGYAFDRFSESAQAASAEARQAASAVAAATSAQAPAAKAIDHTGAAAASAAKRMEDLKRAGEQLTQEMRTPIEVFADEIARLDELLGAGAVSWETYSRAVNKARDDLDQASESARQLDQPRAMAIGAATRDTAAGFSAAQAGQREMVRLAEIAEKDRQEQAKHTRLLEDIRRASRERAPEIRQVSL